MKSTEKPNLIVVPFASAGDYNEIATKSTESSLAKGVATYLSGFPPLTMTVCWWNSSIWQGYERDIE
ncbi:hypothetical protein [Photorhabdus cinerea]|uniref:Uncharacterized protein n=1 Tax=Photorhabdus cinerea TaxID=471575 RepID=A0A7X5QEW6_9GAMM|nr:hypothetical protein [Photorhabdus cinerea]NHB93164.1 hypothetical protein [Photorhabdus cinerea]